MQKREFPTLEQHLYCDENLRQYLPDNVVEFEKIEEPPDKIDDLEYHMRVLAGDQGQEAIATINTLAISQGRQASRNLSDDRRAAETGLKLDIEQVVKSIAKWNYSDNGSPMKITIENFLGLPLWMVNKIQDSYAKINLAKN